MRKTFVLSLGVRDLQSLGGWFGKCPPHVGHAQPASCESPDEEIDRHGRVSRLHTGNAGLTGADELCYLGLRVLLLDSSTLELAGESDFDLNNRRFRVTHPEKVLRAADSPPRLCQS